MAHPSYRSTPPAAGQDRPAGHLLVESIHRLAEETGRGRRHAADNLAAALTLAVTDAVLADQATDVLAAANPAIWLDLDIALRRRDDRNRTVDRSPLPLALVLTACARRGRKREWAVRHPVMRDDLRPLPVLLVRSTDWAEAVRAPALKVLREVLTDGNVPATALASAASVAVRLADRVRGGPALDLVCDALVRAGDDTLDGVRACADPRGRRYAFDVVLRAGRMDHGRLVAAARHEPDSVIRTRCATELAEQAVAQDRPELAEEILDGTSAAGRVQALTALVRLGHTRHASRFLDDVTGMVRLTAQWGLRRAGGDPAELYRRRVENGGATRGLLAGLGDCGARADGALVEPYLRDPRPRVRAEAVRTLRRLGARADVAALLGDPAPVVVRNVVTTLLADGPGVPVERLWALCAAGRPRHVRVAAYRLLARRDAWSRIHAGLRLVSDPDETLRGLAHADLTLWCRADVATAYRRPCPAALREKLVDLTRTAAEALGAESTRLLLWSLRDGTG
ncbi:hypothetical protein ACFQYP_44710 [Nonomuraea antimicrobica]|uniref:hypothetical protein n=1 Tax=Nonomuraea antimicrobica TaxID=561173 RepID=UPI0031ED8DE6